MEPLRATCTTKVKANSVKQEFEKQDELKRSALRAVAALLHIPDSGQTTASLSEGAFTRSVSERKSGIASKWVDIVIV